MRDLLVISRGNNINIINALCGLSNKYWRNLSGTIWNLTEGSLVEVVRWGLAIWRAVIHRKKTGRTVYQNVNINYLWWVRLPVFFSFFVCLSVLSKISKTNMVTTIIENTQTIIYPGCDQKGTVGDPNLHPPTKINN